jgi:CRISPR-associated endoribonuclease Cas6
MSTPDLTSLIVTVTPPEPVTTPAHLGRAVYHAWLDYIKADDPALAQALHDSQERKPFTCTALAGGQRAGQDSRRYQPDQPAWFRLTGLNLEVSRHLLRLRDDPPARWELDGIPFQVQTVTTDRTEHIWANHTGYEELAAPYLLARRRPDFRLGLEFATPTTFRDREKSWPVPMPMWVFGSLLASWNLFSPVQIPAEVRRFAEECVVLSQYKLETRALPLKAQIPQMGCVGEAVYVILNRDKYWSSMLNLLVEYAFYAGVGYQTTVGMGQTRPLPPRQRQRFHDTTSD